MDQSKWCLRDTRSGVVYGAREDKGKDSKRCVVCLVANYDTIIARSVVEGGIAPEVVRCKLPSDKGYILDFEIAVLGDLGR